MGRHRGTAGTLRAAQTSALWRTPSDSPAGVFGLLAAPEPKRESGEHSPTDGPALGRYGGLAPLILLNATGVREFLPSTFTILSRSQDCRLDKSLQGQKDERVLGNHPSRSAMRTRSARDEALIFCMTRLRWALTVFSPTASFAAICLFGIPLTIKGKTSRSRGDSER